MRASARSTNSHEVSRNYVSEFNAHFLWVRDCLLFQQPADSLANHLKLRRLILNGARSDHDIEPARLDDAVHIKVQK